MIKNDLMKGMSFSSALRHSFESDTIERLKLIVEVRYKDLSCTILNWDKVTISLPRRADVRDTDICSPL